MRVDLTQLTPPLLRTGVHTVPDVGDGARVLSEPLPELYFMVMTHTRKIGRLLLHPTVMSTVTMPIGKWKFITV